MTHTLRMLAIALALSVASPASAEVWTIDPAHTVTGFTARHMMITNVTGVFENTAGTIDYTPG
jgi:polyisoprenoid-binding protein YceI